MAVAQNITDLRSAAISRRINSIAELRSQIKELKALEEEHVKGLKAEMIAAGEQRVESNRFYALLTVAERKTLDQAAAKALLVLHDIPVPMLSSVTETLAIRPL